MRNVNCLQISQNLAQAKSKRGRFFELYQNPRENVNELTSLKNELMELTKEMLEAISYRQFLAELRKPETLDKIKDVFIKDTHEYNITLEMLDSTLDIEVGKIFDDLEVKGELNDAQYARFMEELQGDWDFRKKLEVVAKQVNSEIMKVGNNTSYAELYDSANPGVFYALINTAFINKYLPSDGVLNVKDVRASFWDRFGIGLTHGTVNVDTVGDYAGARLRGGRLNIERGGHWAGFGMSKGELNVDEIGTHAGIKAQGGVLVVNKSANESLGIYAGSKFTIIAEGIEQVRVESNKSNALFLVDEKFKEEMEGMSVRYNYLTETSDGERFYAVFDPPGSDMPIETIEDGPDLWQFLVDGEARLGVIKDANRFNQNPTNGLGKGILSIDYKNYMVDWGRGMQGGVLIIENSELSIVEAKERVSKARSGGVVMIRVEDPENLGKTKLVRVG